MKTVTPQQVQSALAWVGRFGHTERGYEASVLATALLGVIHSLGCIEERAGRMKGKAEGDRPFASATQACAWIEKECRGQLAAVSVRQPITAENQPAMLAPQ